MAKNKWNGPPREARCLLSEFLHSVPQVIPYLDTDETIKLEISDLLAQLFFWHWILGGFKLSFFLINIFPNSQIMAELLQSVMKKKSFYLLIRLVI